MNVRALRSIILLASAPSLVQAGDVTGMFSSMQMSEQSGDYTGLEIHVVPALSSFAIVVQASEGTPGVPDVFTLSVEGENARFTVPPTSRCGLAPGDYEARILEDTFVLLSPHKKRIVPRQQSHWR